MNFRRPSSAQLAAIGAGAAWLAWTAATSPGGPGRSAALAWSEVGFLAGALWWMLLRRRFFPDSGATTGVLGLLVLAAAGSGQLALRRAVGAPHWAAESALAALFFLLLLQALTGRRPVGWLLGAAAVLGAAAAVRPVYAAPLLALLLPLRWSWWRFRPSGGWHLAVFAAVAVGAAAAGWHQLGPDLAGWRPDLSRLRFGLWADYLSSPQWGRYFPFLEQARPPLALPALAWLALPGGLLTLFPLGWLALGAPLAARPLGERRDVGAFLRAVVMYHVGLAAGLILCRGRSDVDFTALLPSLSTLACAGWLGLEHELPPGGWRRAALGLAGAAAAVSLALGLLLNLSWERGLERGSPGFYRRLAHLLDRPAAWAERDAGRGALDLLVRFPAFRPGAAEPVAATGFAPALDRVAVRYLGASRLQWGAAHGAGPWSWGPAVTADPSSLHRVRIEMGSLFPPREHPYFDALAPRERERRARRARIVLDGRTALDLDQDFFPSSPGTLRLGAPGPGLPERFGGQILGARRGDWGEPEGALASLGPLRLIFTIPTSVYRAGLPLLSTGERGRGGVLLLRTVRPGEIRFGYDQWLGGALESAGISVAPGSVHRIEVRLPALQGAAGSAEERAENSSLAVEMDGRMVWAARLPPPPPAVGQVYLGRNEVGASTAQEAFPSPLEAEWAALTSAPRPGPAGTVRILLQWPRNRTGLRQPLVVAGTAGAGDLLAVEYFDAGRVRFTLDHWGRSFLASPPLATDFSGIHLLEISLPDLKAPPVGSGEYSGQVRVVLDGAVAWTASSAFFRSPPDTLTLAEDRIGGSCDEEFTGGIAVVVRGKD